MYRVACVVMLTVVGCGKPQPAAPVASQPTRNEPAAAEPAKPEPAKPNGEIVNLTDVLAAYQHQPVKAVNLVKDKAGRFRVKVRDFILAGDSTLILSGESLKAMAHFDVSTDPKRAEISKGDTIVIQATLKRVSLNTLIFENCRIE